MSVPVPALFWPLTLTSSNNGLQFSANPVGAPVLETYDGTVAAGTYYSPATLGTAIAAGIQASVGATSAATYNANGGTSSVSVSAAGIMTITLGNLENGSTATLLWGSGGGPVNELATLLGYGTNGNGNDIGHTVAANVGANTADYQIRNYWSPGVAARRIVPFRESSVSTSRTADGHNKHTRWNDLQGQRVEFAYLPAYKCFGESETADSSTQNHAFSGPGPYGGADERFFESTGVGRFAYWPDRSVAGTYTSYFLDEESCQRFEPERMESVDLYSFALKMWEYQS